MPQRSQQPRNQRQVENDSVSVCPSDFDLDRYHAGEMNDGEVGRVREHLASCESCAKRDAAIVAGHENLVRHVRDLKGTFGLDDDVDSPVGVSGVDRFPPRRQTEAMPNPQTGMSM